MSDQYNSCTSCRQIIMPDLCFAFNSVYDHTDSHIHRCVYRHNQRPSSFILTSQVKVITTMNLKNELYSPAQNINHAENNSYDILY